MAVGFFRVILARQMGFVSVATSGDGLATCHYGMLTKTIRKETLCLKCLM